MPVGSPGRSDEPWISGRTLLQPLFKGRDVHGASEQEALHRVAAEGAKHAGLLVRLDALADHLRVQDDDVRAAMNAVRPVLSDWLRSRRSRSVLDSWRHRVTFKPLTSERSSGLGGAIWWLVAPAAAESPAGLASTTNLRPTTLSADPGRGPAATAGSARAQHGDRRRTAGRE